MIKHSHDNALPAANSPNLVRIACRSTIEY